MTTHNKFEQIATTFINTWLQKNAKLVLEKKSKEVALALMKDLFANSVLAEKNKGKTITGLLVTDRATSLGLETYSQRLKAKREARREENEKPTVETLAVAISLLANEFAERIQETKEEILDEVRKMLATKKPAPDNGTEAHDVTGLDFAETRG